ncbi:L-arabinose isomerase [Prolixibacter denitrificans]|jgi:L-arabinose isomerase|uniref:L-arabinose isomerase n=1 Tax=Prolixibacter denitrificans TaxID=1541063 RepID=A0A2P8C690_9BACT|nr:L-arabinose isomerase [Prolixibacter denitrificans]PSK80488.1 L-arabinose isomerase [Prolixibacter denitrificans]GET22734.1 L-arabinose isomerase [Prolixibacter denitrificans]
MKEHNQKVVWFVTGSQHLYGPETLKQVDTDSETIVKGLNASEKLPVEVVFKPVVKTPDEILNICVEANSDASCIGVITWMHTFSPAKMWIAGLKTLNKPYMHLHTQFNRDIPWDEIDMDFMNLNQSAHGGREYGFINARMRKNRKVVVGHWQDEEVQAKVGAWCRTAIGWADSQGLKVARFGDNMREVAVTEGDKVEAQIKFGWQISAFGVGDLVKYVDAVSDADVDALVEEYNKLYDVADNCKKGGEYYENVRVQARYEIALKRFMEDGDFKAFTTNFENLTGLSQLPGLASQRLMAAGYGFGAEGDWKQAAMLRIIKTMSTGLKGGSSFMEDYTYHLDPAAPAVLGSHMLEICPSIAAKKPKLEVHPLGIGGKDAPARLVFDSETGDAMNVTLIDMGNRFRVIVNTLDVIEPYQDLPKLPVARALWKTHPNLEDGAAAWIYAGGTHHSVFTLALTPEFVEDFAELADVEYILIDKDTKVSELKKELRWNEVYYMLKGGIN